MLSLNNQPAHGLAEIRHLFFFATLALAALYARALAQQFTEVRRSLRQSSVIRTVHKVLRDDTAFDVAVVVAADTQHRFVSAYVKFSGNFRAAAKFAQFVLQADRRKLSDIQVIKIQRHAVGHGSQSFGIHDVAQARNHSLSQLVLSGQFCQRLTTQTARVDAAGKQGGIFQGNAHQKHIKRRLVLEVLLFLADLDFVQRRLRNVNMPALNQLRQFARQAHTV